MMYWLQASFHGKEASRVHGVSTPLLILLTSGELQFHSHPPTALHHPALGETSLGGPTCLLTHSLQWGWQPMIFEVLGTPQRLLGLPRWCFRKEPACQCRRCKRHKRCGFCPWVGKIPWRRAWQPTPVFPPGESPRTEKPGRLQSTGSHRVRHDWSDLDKDCLWWAHHQKGHAQRRNGEL